MIEFKFINHPNTDCKPFHDALQDYKDFVYTSGSIDSIAKTREYLNHQKKCILIIAVSDFPEDIQYILNHIINNNTPFILRYSEELIKNEKLSDFPFVVNEKATKEMVKIALDFCINNIKLQESFFLPKEIIEVILIEKNTINSIPLCDEYNEERLEFRKDIINITHVGDRTEVYLENNKVRYSKLSVDVLTFMLKDDGMLKVHQSEAVCEDKVIDIYDKNGYKLVLTNKKIVPITRPNVERVVPIISANMKARGLIVKIRWRERKEK